MGTVEEFAKTTIDLILADDGTEENRVARMSAQAKRNELLDGATEQELQEMAEMIRTDVAVLKEMFRESVKKMTE